MDFGCRKATSSLEYPSNLEVEERKETNNNNKFL